jgi:superfamily I DNA/RNA helicase
MVLYLSRKSDSSPDDEVPVFLGSMLEEHGIMTSWTAKNAQSKASWDITTDSVTISTIHSMKGLDAEAVFAWGLDGLDSYHFSNEHIESMAYVACTRARTYLDILYYKKTPIIDWMLQKYCLF